MLFDLKATKENLRNREGKRVFFLGKGDQLTSEARDYLTRERIEILPASAAKRETYALLSGGFVTEKPEDMTHLNGDVLVKKNHPRIRFRGALDTLEAELLLCQLSAAEPLRGKLGEVLALVRNIVRWDVLNEPVEEKPLCGLTADQLRTHSHRPQEFYGQPHFMPSVEDGAVILQLNRCRCAARAAELLAVDAFSDREGNPTRLDILTQMNRLSSMLYVFMIEEKAGK